MVLSKNKYLSKLIEFIFIMKYAKFSFLIIKRNKTELVLAKAVFKLFIKMYLLLKHIYEII